MTTLTVEDSGKMVVNKPITFRAQITPHFTVRSPALARSDPSTLSSEKSDSRAQSAPPSETCTLSLIQENGAKSTLEVIASRFRLEWRCVDPVSSFFASSNYLYPSLDSGLDPSTPRTPVTRGLF